MEQQKMIGMVFPITGEMFRSLGRRTSAVLCKFTPQANIPKQMKAGQKIIFYLANRMVGEGLITKIELASCKDILKKYIKNLLVTEKEFYDYVGIRFAKKMLLVKMSKIKLYKREVSSIYPVPMSGRYIREKEYCLFNN